MCIFFMSSGKIYLKFYLLMHNRLQVYVDHNEDFGFCEGIQFTIGADLPVMCVHTWITIWLYEIIITIYISWW